MGRLYFQFSYIPVGLLMWVTVNMGDTRVIKKFKSIPHEATFQIQMTVHSVYLMLMIHAAQPSGHFINISDGVLETTDMDQNIASI